MSRNLELDIAAILDLVIITITIVYQRTPCAFQTRQARLHQLISSTKITVFPS